MNLKIGHILNRVTALCYGGCALLIETRLGLDLAEDAAGQHMRIIHQIAQQKTRPDTAIQSFPGSSKPDQRGFAPFSLSIPPRPSWTR
jgi:hypothetical protein